ncbi:MAG: CBS domain-containing protein [Deltaproteobacteria bacterium]|nr:CBS domain-containing protein [Deltaproteobacteria bacterium]
MSKHIPPIEKYMSTSPVTVEPSTTLPRAKQLLQEHGIRHLPVVERDVLVGLVSASDLRAIEGLAGVKPEDVRIKDVMREKPFTCRPDSPLDATVNEMVSHKWGSAVVLHNQRVVGIFTSIDAMRALVELAQTRLVK